MSWELPFTLGTTTSLFGGTTVGTSAPGYTGETVVEQRRGGGRPYVRSAVARLGAAVQQSAQTFQRPIVGVADANLLVSGQLPWMLYREPQAVAVDASTLSLRFVSETLMMGEGKGIWNRARVGLTPVAATGGNLASFLDTQRRLGAARLERGLLLLAPRATTNASRILPSLGTDATSAIKTAYLSWMELLHGETVDAGGQYDRAKRYGSQLWPDAAGNDPFGVDAAVPNESVPGMNYWDPAGAEVVELLRSGNPKWAWDFALPAYWTQAMAAYLNIGSHTHGNENGMAVQSGGPGCPYDPDGGITQCTADGTGGGQWHRTNFGSVEYTYAMSMDLGYAVQPSLLMRDRFAEAGRTAIDRFSIPQSNQGAREMFVNQVDVTRQVIQSFVMLANCAEFVPGARGQACQDRLLEVYDELAEDNLAAGVLCQGDAVSFTPPNFCITPQQFMQNALMYRFFHRMYRNYGDPPSGSVRRALVESPRTLYQWGMAKLGNGVDVDPEGDWADGLRCTLNGAGTAVASCVAEPDSDGNLAMYRYNKPHTVALLLMAHEIDPTVGLCGIGRNAYDTPSLPSMLGDAQHFNQAGWWKAVAQMMQSLPYGIGIYDTCTP
jgi:hypothetical protein